MNNNVRVRFAPSPTGPLHIGGLRTALYNFLFARKHKGSFILRIEDTDQSRFIPGTEKYILDSLEWSGIIPDESPMAGGAFEPYRQSERKDIYLEHVHTLIEKGHAYYAFDSLDELDSARKQFTEIKSDPFQYNVHTRSAMKNSLTLTDIQVQKLLDSKEPYVVRFKVPKGEAIVLKDLIRGEVKVSSEEIDDKILLKSDGMPTYHLANVIDDHLMKISHVIRGEEWLPSAPLHVLLYRYLGWESTMPNFAHLPLILKPDGNGKLSKRDGIRFGFPVFPLEWADPESGEQLTGFRESGYLPDALINFLAFLGWNPGTEQEIFTLDNLIKEFSIERIGKGGAKFDIEKVNWFNQQYLKEKPADFLLKHLEQSLSDQNILSPLETNLKVAEAMRQRIVFPHEIWEKGKFFYVAPDTYDDKVVRKKWNPETADLLVDYAIKLEKHTSIDSIGAKETLSSVLELHNMGMGKVMQVLRVALTGESGGPDLMTVIEILGPKESSNRITKAIEVFKKEV